MKDEIVKESLTYTELVSGCSGQNATSAASALARMTT